MSQAIRRKRSEYARSHAQIRRILHDCSEWWQFVTFYVGFGAESVAS